MKKEKNEVLEKCPKCRQYRYFIHYNTCTGHNRRCTHCGHEEKIPLWEGVACSCGKTAPKKEEQKFYPANTAPIGNAPCPD